jgi:hypothetical protein
VGNVPIPAQTRNEKSSVSALFSEIYTGHTYCRIAKEPIQKAKDLKKNTIFYLKINVFFRGKSGASFKIRD